MGTASSVLLIALPSLSIELTKYANWHLWRGNGEVDWRNRSRGHPSAY